MVCIGLSAYVYLGHILTALTIYNPFKICYIIYVLSTEVFMTISSASLRDNIALGMGVILTLNFSDGSAIDIPCHNDSTANWIYSNWHREDVRKMAASWAS